MELRLMIEVPVATTTSILVNEKHWALSDPFPVDDQASSPPYICASYVWGSGRVPNPIHPSLTMSDRTLATFAAAARCLPGRPIWIDAFCVPVERAKKRATLESLGFLFARAAAVVAVLAPSSLAAIERMAAFLALEPRPADVPSEPIAVLEADEWIRSVWTYQELVNCKELWFSCNARGCSVPDSGDGKAFTGNDLLGVVGGYLDRWARSERTAQGKRLFGIRQLYPHADNFQELLADWQVAAYAQRSALQIMSGMEERTNVSVANRFYSMIGALTVRPSTRATEPSVEQLAERFMELCEEKGDYSFIFSLAPRDPRPGRRWRPLPCVPKPLLTWHVFGELLPGEKLDGGVLLKDVFVLSAVPRDPGGHSQINGATEAFFRRWADNHALYHDVPVHAHASSSILEEQGYHILQTMNFEGDDSWYVTEIGVFYPLQKPSSRGQVTICVSHGVRWVFGGPALGLFSSDLDVEPEYILGIFVGDMTLGIVTEFLLR
ncbi:hypothetical protein BD413DRAFT_168006 [Trametes elegans]|nr:hypothetical protein BD413DRAFT_168006 [Trametes elegans]